MRYRHVVIADGIAFLDLIYHHEKLVQELNDDAG